MRIRNRWRFAPRKNAVYSAPAKPRSLHEIDMAVTKEEFDDVDWFWRAMKGFPGPAQYLLTYIAHAWRHVWTVGRHAYRRLSKLHPIFWIEKTTSRTQELYKNCGLDLGKKWSGVASVRGRHRNTERALPIVRHCAVCDQHFFRLISIHNLLYEALRHLRRGLILQ